MLSPSKIDDALLFSLLDLTSLNPTDDADSIAALCRKAVLPSCHVAAVCVYPSFVRQAADALRDSPVRIATVVNFPNGDESLPSVLAAIHAALQDGAHEIDVVFPYSRYLAGHTAEAADFIRACKTACGNHLLKVILETGVLVDPVVMAKVSALVIAAGADFLKTSTGKVAVGATLEAAAVMLEEIKRSHQPVGLKVSGGIRQLAQAAEYVALAERVMGVDWVTPAHMRIGASQLADGLRAALLE